MNLAEALIYEAESMSDPMPSIGLIAAWVASDEARQIEMKFSNQPLPKAYPRRGDPERDRLRIKDPKSWYSLAEWLKRVKS